MGDIKYRLSDFIVNGTVLNRAEIIDLATDAYNEIVALENERSDRLAQRIAARIRVEVHNSALEEAARRLEEYWTRHRGCQCARFVRGLKE